MDENNISYQILSPTSPGLQFLKYKNKKEIIKKAQEVNDYMYSKIKDYPNRFKVFAVLPIGYSEEASVELDRCAKKLGMVGALVNGNTIIYKNNKPLALFYDTPDYNILWKKFVELDVPLYIHPAVYPSIDEIVPDKNLNPFTKNILY